MLRRYESMVRIQVETLDGIDDKAAYTARLVALLVGVVLTGVSIVISSDILALSTETGAAFLTIALAVVAFTTSMIFAIFTYLSSRFEYGPSPDAGRTLAKKNISEDRYKEMMLRTYADVLESNYSVVVDNNERFETSLTALLVGILFLFATGVLLALPGGVLADALILLVFAGLSIRISLFILDQEYITLDRLS